MNSNNVTSIKQATGWHDVCVLDDLVPYSGVPALVAGTQVAIFHVPDANPPIYAVDNFCPCANANVLARGIVGDINGELVVASPLYKEHFRLTTGECVEKPAAVRVWPVQLQGERVLLKQPTQG